MSKLPKIWIEGNTLYKKEHEKDKLLMANGAWTISLNRNFNGIDKIVYQTEKGEYMILKEVALRVGFTRIFKGESKLVVPLKSWVFIRN